VTIVAPVAVAGSAIKWLRDSMMMIQTADEVNTLARQVPNAGGVYFVTAFSGLLAPYWDSCAAGLLIGLSSYTNKCHIARATLEANAFQTRAILESMKLDSNVELKHLKVDGGMTNGDVAMEILADIGGFTVIRPQMREHVTDLFSFAFNLLFCSLRSTALGSALLAGSAIGLFGWDITKPETMAKVNTKDCTVFKPSMQEAAREKKWQGWQRAVDRSRKWDEGNDSNLH